MEVRGDSSVGGALNEESGTCLGTPALLVYLARNFTAFYANGASSVWKIQLLSIAGRRRSAAVALEVESSRQFEEGIVGFQEVRSKGKTSVGAAAGFGQLDVGAEPLVNIRRFVHLGAAGIDQVLEVCAEGERGRGLVAGVDPVVQIGQRSASLRRFVSQRCVIAGVDLSLHIVEVQADGDVRYDTVAEYGRAARSGGQQVAAEYANLRIDTQAFRRREIETYAEFSPVTPAAAGTGGSEDTVEGEVHLVAHAVGALEERVEAKELIRIEADAETEGRLLFLCGDVVCQCKL